MSRASDLLEKIDVNKAMKMLDGLKAMIKKM